jgi:TP901 family phage tail tape measure protein
MSDARANIEITASSRRLASGLSAARSTLNSWASAAARGIDKAFEKVKPGKTASSAIGNFLGGLATRGLDVLVDAAQDVRTFERNLIRYQITTNGTAASTAALRSQIRGVSRDTGIASDQILAGASQYVALTGDANGAKNAMTAFARIAQASGSSVDDVASATAALRTSMGLDSKDIEAAFSGMIVQGKQGAVELKDMAGELSALAPQFASFRGAKGLGGIRELGAALQVVRTGAGSASMAATNLRALMTQIADPKVINKLSALKIRIFDKDPATGLTTMRSASDIINDLAKNQKLLDPRVMAKVFGREEARAALRSLQQNVDMYGELRRAAEDTGAVQRDLNTFLESDAGKIDRAFNNAKLALAEVFTPERIASFSHALAVAVDMLAKIVGYAEKLAKFVDKVVDTATGEGKAKLGAKQAADLTEREAMARNSYGSPRANREALAKYFLGQASELYQAQDKNPLTGYEATLREAKIEEFKRRGFALQEQTDLWGATQTSQGMYDARSGRVNPIATGGITNEQAGKIFLDDLKYTIGKSISDGLAGAKFDISRDKVVDAARNGHALATKLGKR